VIEKRFRGKAGAEKLSGGVTMMMNRFGAKRLCVNVGLCLFTASVLVLSVSAQDNPDRQHRVPAEFMSYLGADWLERVERADEEQPERVLDSMALNKGDVVADIGCGSGYYARRMARRVMPQGRVLCEDIQPEMLDIMRQRAADEGLSGIEAVLGTPTDPRLALGIVDWIIIADVYHEMSQPEAMLARIRSALSPTGRVALLEYRVEDGTGDQIKADHVMSVRQVLQEWRAAGFALVGFHEFLPSQHLFFFGDVDRADNRNVLYDYDLFDAMEAELVEVEARGAGDDLVRLRIRRRGNDPLLVTSPVATYFQAPEGRRDMIARRDGWVLLDDDDWHDWTLRAVGRQRSLDASEASDALVVHPPSMAPNIEAVLRAVQVGTYTVSNSPVLYPPRTHVVDQAAVWIADTDATYVELESEIAGPRVPASYAAAFALVFVDQAGIDVTTRPIWNDHDRIFSTLRDQGLTLWHQLKMQ